MEMGTHLDGCREKLSWKGGATMAENGKMLVKYETEHGEITLSPQIIKRYLVSGDADKVTDQEVMMFLALCKYQRLNPFLREAYLIKFGNNPATIVTGKETFTKRAAANQLCKGWEAGIIVQTKQGIEQRAGTFIAPGEELAGGWARVHRQDWSIPLEITVSLSEYQRYNSKGELMRNWREMPATMIRKVALVQALREAMPQEFQGMYSPEEMPIDVSQLNQEPVHVTQDYKEEATQRKSQSNGFTPATENQLKKLYAMSKELGLEKETMTAIMQERYGKASSKELTKAEASDLIEYMTKMENGEESWPITNDMPFHEESEEEASA